MMKTLVAIGRAALGLAVSVFVGVGASAGVSAAAQGQMVLRIGGVTAQTRPQGQSAAKAPTDTLRVTVYTADTTWPHYRDPLVGATVKALIGDSVVRTRKTDSLGEVPILCPHCTRLTVEAPNYRLGLVNLTAPPGEHLPPHIEFHLRHVIGGSVLDDKGQIVAGAEVSIDSAGGRDVHMAARRSPMMHTVTDAKGRFTLAPPAYYNFEGRGWQPPLTVVASVGHGARVGVLAPLDAALLIDVPNLTITVGPTRPVHVQLALTPAGVPPDSVAIEVMPSTWNGAPPAEWVPHVFMPITVTRADSVNWGTTVSLPERASYRVVMGLTTDVPEGRSDIFQVPVGTTPVEAPVLAINMPVWAQHGTPAPEISASTLDGKPVHLADYHGKAVVLTFWGTWCETCIARFPELVRLAQVYRDSGVVFLALHDATVGSVADYQAHFKVSVTPVTGMDSLPFLVLVDQPTPQDAGFPPAGRAQGAGLTATTYALPVFPTTIVIDRAGHIVGNSAAMDFTVQRDSTGRATWNTLKVPPDEPLAQLIHRALAQ